MRVATTPSEGWPTMPEVLEVVPTIHLPSLGLGAGSTGLSDERLPERFEEEEEPLGLPPEEK